MFEVGRNARICHPETCNCNDWAIYKGDIKYSTHFKREAADEVCAALNRNFGTMITFTEEENKREIRSRFYLKSI